MTFLSIGILTGITIEVVYISLVKFDLNEFHNEETALFFVELVSDFSVIDWGIETLR